jgi:PAS domain S-box-containing protein
MPSQPLEENDGQPVAPDVLVAALDAVEQPVWVVDASGLIRFANPAAVAALGYADGEQLLGRDSHETIHHHHPDGRPFPAAECRMLRPRTTGETVTSDLDWFFRCDGSMFRVSYVSAPLEMTDGRGAVVAFTDIDARSRAEQALRDREARLADEQAALRRVGTLAARGASRDEVFTAIARECAALFGTAVAGTVDIAMVRFEGDSTQFVVASSGKFKEAFPHGSRKPLGGENVASRVFRTGRAVRIDEYAIATGPIGEAARSLGLRSAVGTPIEVEGRLWGAMITGTAEDEPLPPDTEARLGQFTELMAAAIANTESRARANRLTEEQAALRRVATLVAQGTPSDALFSAVCDEVEALAGADASAVVRFETDDTVTVMGTHAGQHTVGARLELDPGYVVAEVHRTGRAARFDTEDPAAPGMPEVVRAERVRSGLASPIVVVGELWGAITAASRDRPLPAGTERRLADFTDLVATAIANTHARQQVSALADEQAALRRVATLVAQGASPAEVFDAVAAEMEGVLDADGVTVSRYEPDSVVTVLAHRGADAQKVPPGSRWNHEGENVTSVVRRTERPARMETYARTDGQIAELVENLGVKSAVGAPIVVEGRLWGVIIANWRGDEQPPAGTEERMAQFAQLLDTAVANADSRDQLTASRARLVTEADEARRRVVRDLHDGAQQRLVHAIVTLKLARRAMRADDDKADELAGEALRHAEQGNVELRELAHGILPAVLTRGGLRAGVDAVVARLDVPVEVRVPAGRFAAEIEASAYFIVAEALTNVVKHAQAARAEVAASVEGAMLRVEVRDDGLGGANPEGHGLVGLRDRATALGGRLDVDSPDRGGTVVTATLPLRSG